jgi:UPF0716 protein FxsA
VRPGFRIRLALVSLVVAEAAVLVLATRWLGGWVVFWLVLATSLLGGWVVRNEGVRAWTALSEAVQAGRMPEHDVTASRYAIVGGFLMILPGFVTDLIGAALVVPLTRSAARRLLSGLRLLPAYRPGPSGRPPDAGDVIEGEIIDGDDPPRHGELPK